MAYLVEFLAVESLGRCYLRNGSEIIATLERPLTTMMMYSRLIPGYDETTPKVAQNVSDPIFMLNLDFKPNVNTPFEIIALPDEPKLREFDLQYW